MQTLYFEPAWDKTIANADRDLITQHFQTLHPKEDIYLSFLRVAVNHKNELLATVLIHNGQAEPLHFKETAIAFQPAQGATKTGLFHLPVSIPAKTSMPWTFIFSASNQTDQKPIYIIHENDINL